MESETSIPANWNEIPKFKSDTSKWVYFFANVTEDVWVQLKECLEADYSGCQFHFQLTQHGVASATGTEETKVIDNFRILYFVFLQRSFRLFLHFAERINDRSNQC